MSKEFKIDKPETLSVKRFDRAHKVIFESVKAKKVISSGMVVSIADLHDFLKWEFIFTKTTYLTINEITQNYQEGVKQRRMCWPLGKYVRYINDGSNTNFVDENAEFVGMSIRDLNANDWEVVL